jgi:hypothetical protein
VGSFQFFDLHYANVATQIATQRDGTDKNKALQTGSPDPRRYYELGPYGTNRDQQQRRLSVFETAPFDRSGTSPSERRQ